MYLKQLEMRGFKSFARGIEINFNPGLNIIVGPNGCGKSNIADAIRWVLGESNVRHLRGQRGEDVIFTGTDKKKPLGMAAVSITVDNADQILSSEFSELTISRRIYRSGESEFLLNMNEVRLKDIHNLLAGTGMGKRGYSVIGQGELEQVLDAKPFERRLIMEEAAGLSGFRQKKEEAETRLSSSALDLLRLEDILGEVFQRVDELKSKSLKAQEFIQLSGDLEIRERKIMAFELAGFEREKSVRDREEKEISIHLAAISREIASNDEIAEQSRTVLNGLRDEIARCKDEKYEQVNLISKLQGDRRVAEERIINSRTRLGQMDKDVARHRDLMLKIEADLLNSVEDLSEKESELDQKTIEAEGLNNQISSENQAAAQIQIEINLIQTAERKLSQDLTDLAGQCEQIEAAIRNKRATAEQIRTDKYYLDEKMAQEQSSLDALNQDYATGQASLGELNRITQALREDWEVEAENSRQADLKSNRLKKDLNDLSFEINDLENRIAARTGMSDGVKKLLKAVEDNPQAVPGMVGVIADLIEVPPGLEVAIEAVVGRNIENVVVRSETDARSAITLLKEQSWGRVTFLPLSMIRSQAMDAESLKAISRIKGVLGAGTELIGFRPEHRKAVDYILGRVLIVEDLQAGMEVFKKNTGWRIVTTDGDIINPAGAMTGGKVKQHIRSSLHLRADLREKKDRIRSISDDLQRTQESLDSTLASAARKEAAMNDSLLKAKEKTFQQEMIAREVDRIISWQKTAQIKKDELVHGESILQLEIVQLETQYNENAGRLQNLRLESEVLGKKRSEEQQRHNQQAQNLELLSERYKHCRDLIELRQHELDSRRENLLQQEKVKASYEATMQEYDREIERFGKLAQEEASRMDAMQLKIVESGDILEDLEKRLRNLESSIIIEEDKLRKANTTLDSLRIQAASLEARARGVEIKKVRNETELENLYCRWGEKYGDEQHEGYLSGMDHRLQRQYRDECQKIRGSIEEMGPVDISSIDELIRAEQRHNFLQVQIDDLQRSRQSLSHIIEETEDLMNLRFKEFMDQARESFRNTFNTIFKGGEAELHMEDNPDQWRSGVDIIVKMPGKRRQSMNLLSGGERALTCIAFIFSLLILKPTPFCLLDEIDSALDEANLGRFTDFLKQLAEKIQFVVITHRQSTIEAGEYIFGVTMPEQGMSEVFSITAREAENLAI